MKQLVQLQPLQNSPFAKQSQYNFKHCDLVQLQGFLLGISLAIFGAGVEVLRLSLKETVLVGRLAEARCDAMGTLLVMLSIDLLRTAPRLDVCCGFKGELLVVKYNCCIWNNCLRPGAPALELIGTRRTFRAAGVSAEVGRAA